MPAPRSPPGMAADRRDGLTRVIDALNVRHVVLFALAYCIFNSLRTPNDVSLKELNRGAGVGRVC